MSPPTSSFSDLPHLGVYSQSGSTRAWEGGNIPAEGDWWKFRENPWYASQKQGSLKGSCPLSRHGDLVAMS